MGSGSKFGLTVKSTTDNGSTTIWMVSATINTPIKSDTMDNLSQTKSKDSVYTPGQTEGSMKDGGTKVNNMVLVLTQVKTRQ